MAKSDEVFGTWTRDHRPLSDALNGRLGLLEARLRALRPNELEQSDEDLLRVLADSWMVTAPILGPAARNGPTSAWRQIVEVVQADLVLPIIDGEADLLTYWPDNVGLDGALAHPSPAAVSSFDPLPPSWRLEDEVVRYRVQALVDDASALAATLASTLEAEEHRARAIAAAIPACLDAWSRSVEEDIRHALATLRKRARDLEDLRDSVVHLPEFAPPTLHVRVERPKPDDASVRQHVVLRLPPKAIIEEDEWAGFVKVLQRWGRALSQHPAVCQLVDEFLLRDLLLATLRSVYPVAEAEVMTAGLKSDIYVLVDPLEPELRPIIAELKYWTGQSAVEDDIDQNRGQLTLADSRGLVLYFIRAQGFREINRKLSKSLAGHPAFLGWSPENDVGTWRGVRMRSHIDPTETVLITVGSIHVPKPKPTKKNASRRKSTATAQP